MSQLRQTSEFDKLDWEAWTREFFPQYLVHEPGDRHHELWEWVWSIRKGVRPAPFVAIWPRESGKTTVAELSVAALGARQARGYAWYVRSTQSQANENVSNIGDLLEGSRLEKIYPLLTERAVNRYGHAKGWTRSRLRTASGLIVDAIGLDTAVRGAKVKEQRPDFMVFDDIDEKHDTLMTSEKKVATITHSLLPAGSRDCAILGIQNLILPHGVFSRLAGMWKEPADFLADRVVSGPHPAIEGLQYKMRQNKDGIRRAVITDGKATWDGQSLEVCQRLIDTWGLRAFIMEAQHDVGDNPGSLWSRELLDDTRVAEVPDLTWIVVAVDPPSTSGQCGVLVVGVGKIGKNLHGYVLDDVSPPPGVKPHEWGLAAVAAYHKWNADRIVAEVNHGGDMVENTIRNVKGGELLPYKAVRASRGKVIRAEPVSAIFEQGRGHLVGYFTHLEDQLCQWDPNVGYSPDRLDALVWGFTDLMITGRSNYLEYLQAKFGEDGVEQPVEEIVEPEAVETVDDLKAWARSRMYTNR